MVAPVTPASDNSVGGHSPDDGVRGVGGGRRGGCNDGWLGLVSSCLLVLMLAPPSTPAAVVSSCPPMVVGTGR